jgi:hypothetical protein
MSGSNRQARRGMIDRVRESQLREAQLRKSQLRGAQLRESP